MPTSQTELSEAILLLLNTIKQMLMYGTVSLYQELILIDKMPMTRWEFRIVPYMVE